MPTPLATVSHPTTCIHGVWDRSGASRAHGAREARQDWRGERGRQVKLLIAEPSFRVSEVAARYLSWNRPALLGRKMPSTLSAVQTSALDSILTDAVASKLTPALFFGVTNAEGPLYLRTVGTKLVDDPASDPIDEDTVFWLCSQTKLITTIAALKLIEQGKIALDTPVESVLPELANPVIVTAHDEAGHPTASTPAKGKILFGQLLNHSSGLDYSVDGTAPMTGPTLGMPVACSYTYKEGEGVQKFLEIMKGSLAGIPLRFEPGTNFAYGFSSDIAGFVIERLTGQTLEKYFQEQIFAPLGLTSTSFYLTPPLKERLLPLSYRSPNGTLERWNAPHVVDLDPATVRVHMGGIGLYGSQKDYLTILRHLLQIQAGTATNPILSRASVDSIFESTLPPAGADTLSGLMVWFSPHLGQLPDTAQFGRGVYVNTEDIPGKRRKGSGAWGGWASTSYFVDPTAGVAVVFGTQLVPTGDEMHDRKSDELERVLYSGL
ncbi:beta-lactamase/transpeptidase-like protein [Mycena sanguinolenta]|nr:beta-lactamase/transpeptidase-like protein [Mycena sanguinolenta]